jgi:archaetidylinositol phosphate synthase
MVEHKRVSHSFLDPWIGPRLKALYRHLPIPRWYPPEGIIAVGHLLAILAAVGFAFSTRYWWGGLLIAVGVAGNHFADCIDGTHARATGQCRNGGELLDHFTDPLSFAYWITGWSISFGGLQWGIAGVICLYATAVLTSIKAKLLGEFTLASFGPTEFKSLLVLYGLGLAVLPAGWRLTDTSEQIAFAAFAVMLAVGILQLVVNLMRAVREVNACGAAPDTTDWVTRASSVSPSGDSSHSHSSQSDSSGGPRREDSAGTAP